MRQYEDFLKKKNYRDIVLINILDNIIQSLLKISLI